MALRAFPAPCRAFTAARERDTPPPWRFFVGLCLRRASFSGGKTLAALFARINYPPGYAPVREGLHARQGWKALRPATIGGILPSSYGSTPLLCAGPRQNARTGYPGYIYPVGSWVDTPAWWRQYVPTWTASLSVRPAVQPVERQQGFYRRPASLCRPMRRRRGLVSHPGLQADGRNGAVRAQDSLNSFPQRAVQQLTTPGA